MPCVAGGRRPGCNRSARTSQRLTSSARAALRAGGCWATAGATKTLAVGLGWLPALLLGVVTAVGGGAVRDVALRRVPGILGGNTLYATAALAAAGALVLLTDAGYATAGSVSGLVVGAGLCLVARWRGWILPSADAWSPANVVPVRYRGRVSGARLSHTGAVLSRCASTASSSGRRWRSTSAPRRRRPASRRLPPLRHRSPMRHAPVGAS